MAGKFNFASKLRRFYELKTVLPRICGEESVRFFQDSWKNQGFTNQSVSKWKEVQRRIPGTNPYKYPKNKDRGRRTRSILVGKGSGRLRRSIRRGYTSFSKTVIATDVPYAKYHNEGTDKIPKRQFMGRSKQLDVKVKNTISKELDKIFRK